MGRIANFIARLRGTTAPEAVTIQPGRKDLVISGVALAEANSAYGRPLNPWELPTPPEWLGDNVAMAMDSAGGMGIADLYSWAMGGALHEGIGFLGYPYLAELSQRPEYRRVVEIWAAEATRKWITLSGDEDRIDLIEKEMKRLKVRDRFRKLAEHDGFFGRGQLFIDLGHASTSPELSKPLILKAKMGKGKLKNLKNLEPFWSYPGPYQSTNPLASDYYRPKYWQVMTSVVHSSRLLNVVGREMPDMLKPAYSFGGLSQSQMIKPYVDNWLRARQSVSDLLHAFSTMVLATDMSTILQGGAAKGLLDRLELFNNSRDNRGVMAINKETEELTNVSTPLGSVDKILAQSQEQIASVSGIPLVILLGVTPSGLNASSDGEIRTFYATIKAYQERVFRDPLTKVLELVQLNIDGEIDPDITFEFVDLWETPEAEKANIRKSDADMDVAYVGAGIVSNEEVRARIVQDEDSPYYQMELADEAPTPPEEEEDPFGGGDDDDDEGEPDPKDPGNPPAKGQAHDAEFREDDHPRAANGQFGSGPSQGKNPKRDREVHHTQEKRAQLQKLEDARRKHESDADKGGAMFSGSSYQKTANELGFHPISEKEIRDWVDQLDETERNALERVAQGVIYAMPADMKTLEEQNAEQKPTHPKVAAILGDEGVTKLRALIADKSSTASDVLEALRPLDKAQQQMEPTLPQGAEPDAAFWSSRAYMGSDGEMDAGRAVDYLQDVATRYAEKDGGVGVKSEKKARIVLGPPAAGKSTGAEQIARTEGYAIVDSDDAKKIIPEFDEGVGASAVHEESGKIAENVLLEMLKRGDNVLIPNVGAKSGSIEKRIQLLQSQGYSVTVDLVDVSEDEAARRMAGRALRSGRHIASSYFASIGNGPSETYEYLKANYADVGFGKIDGNGGPREEKYLEAVNHPTAKEGLRLFEGGK